jgi:hypothetical protein
MTNLVPFCTDTICWGGHDVRPNMPILRGSQRPRGRFERHLSSECRFAKAAERPGVNAIPPLENGDRLTRAEFERRLEARPGPRKPSYNAGRLARPGPGRPNQVVGQPVIASPNWASMNLERWATLSVATVAVSLVPAANPAWSAKMQSPSHASESAVSNPALRTAAHSSAARMTSVVMRE